MSASVCPAGNIKANLSGEVRWATYDMDSEVMPTEFVNCTGLRMCLANGGAPVRWVQNTNAPVDARNNVYEFAVEVYVPLLSDLPLVAGFLGRTWPAATPNIRRSSAVKTWKAGANWQVNELDRLPRHGVAGYPGAEPQRPLPARRRVIDGFQGPADGRQQQPAPDLEGQSQPDAGKGANDHAGRHVHARRSFRASACRWIITAPK